MALSDKTTEALQVALSDIGRIARRPYSTQRQLTLGMAKIARLAAAVQALACDEIDGPKRTKDTIRIVVGECLYDVDEAYRRGSAALIEGTSFRSNPYPEETYRHDQWQAAHENEDEPEWKLCVLMAAQHPGFVLPAIPEEPGA